MRLRQSGIAGKTVVILGAGATRGASFVRKSSFPQPPLDTDFFKQVQFIKEEKHRQYIKSLLEFFRSKFGATARMGMENFFARLQFLRELDWARINGAPKKEYDKIEGDFNQCLAALFEESIGGNQCDYHNLLAKSLDSTDTIISFNYDCLIDAALKISGGNRWDSSKGYSCPTKGAITSWDSQATSGHPCKNTIKLLKLHGSLNWRDRDYDVKYISLKAEPYVRRVGKLKFCIIPPEWHKIFVHDDIFMNLWREA